MPTISVIVPVYNVEPYLQRCVDSILSQRYTDFELILVDDGSPDNCGAICDEYAKQDCRIRVIHQENGGLSAARNAGLEAAKGEYLAFVDSDDCIREEMFEVLLQELKRTGADFIKSNFIPFSEDVPPCQAKGVRTVTVYSPLDAIQDFFKTEYTSRKHMKSTVWDALYKRTLFAPISGDALKFPVGKINEDTYIFPELIFRAKKIAHIDEAFYCYFMRADSIVHSGLTEREISSCDLWEHIAKTIRPYTTEYEMLCAEYSAMRYLNVLNRIYYSRNNGEWFRKVHYELLSIRSSLMARINDTKLRNALRLIRCYQLYLVAQRLFRRYVF